MLNGLVIAANLFVVSAGKSIVYGVSRTSNFAHGSLLMVAMFGAWLMVTQLGLDPYVALPGMTATSLLPKAAAAVNITFPQLCQRIVELSWAAREKEGSA